MEEIRDSPFLKERAEGFPYKMAMENHGAHPSTWPNNTPWGLEAKGVVCFNDFKDGEVLPSRFFWEKMDATLSYLYHGPPIPTFLEVYGK